MYTPETISIRPYLVRALHEWCTDNGLTPLMSVHVDDTVLVPREYVKNGEIVLNISFDATSGLVLGNEFIEFKTRFGGVERDVVVPVERIAAIYARESGQGMSFAPESAEGRVASAAATPGKGVPQPRSSSREETLPQPPTSPKGGRPQLRRIK